MELFQLDRFIQAQDSFNTYETALKEVKEGQKRSHWIWYIFPQIDGMGHSSTSKFYGIKSLGEAKAYFENNILRDRLYEITRALLEQNDSAQNIFGDLDAMKVCSCMTLFDLVSPDDVFAKVLEKFYEGKKCQRTLSILRNEIDKIHSDDKKQGVTDRIYNDIKRPMYTPEKLSSLKDDEVFVFGSNLSGAHGGGAARAAMMRFGAVWGQGVGLQGQSYAIPTMQGGVETIKPYVDEFINFARSHKDMFFYVTRIGCGIAGFKDEDIAPLFTEAVGLDNVCLPKSFIDYLHAMPILNAPESFRLMQIGQCRTLADIVKTLNARNHYDSFESLMNDFGDVIEIHKRNRGYDKASIELLEDILRNNERILMNNGRFDIGRFEKLLNKEFESGRVTDIDALFTRRMCAKILIFAKTLNDICQYTNIEDLRYDLLCLATGRMNCGDASYMDDPYPVIGNCPINWFIGGLKHLWNDITSNGILDSDLMEKRMFTDHQNKLESKGINAIINEDYVDDGPCHPEVFYPKVIGTGPVYVKDETSRRYLKACGEGKGPRSGHELYEMNVVLHILRREVRKGEYKYVENRYYIPTKNLHKPIFVEYFGRLHFAGFDEKKTFIKEYTI